METPGAACGAATNVIRTRTRLQAVAEVSCNDCHVIAESAFRAEFITVFRTHVNRKTAWLFAATRQLGLSQCANCLHRLPCARPPRQAFRPSPGRARSVRGTAQWFPGASRAWREFAYLKLFSSYISPDNAAHSNRSCVPADPPTGVTHVESTAGQPEHESHSRSPRLSD